MFGSSLESIDAKRERLLAKVRKLTYDEERKLQELEKAIQVDLHIIQMTADRNEPFGAKLIQYKARIGHLIPLYKQVSRMPGMGAAESVVAQLQDILTEIERGTIAKSDDLRTLLYRALLQGEESVRQIDNKVKILDHLRAG